MLSTHVDYARQCPEMMILGTKSISLMYVLLWVCMWILPDNVRKMVHSKNKSH